MSLEPFSVPFSQPELDDLQGWLARTRWRDEAPGSAPQYGIDLHILQEICRYWRTEFDRKLQVARLSEFHHYRYVSTSHGSDVPVFRQHDDFTLEAPG